jgi:hypothetical protein
MGLIKKHRWPCDTHPYYVAVPSDASFQEDKRVLIYVAAKWPYDENADTQFHLAAELEPEAAKQLHQSLTKALKTLR